MKFRKSIIIDLLILLVPLIAMIITTPYLPEKVPIQWGFSGEVTRTVDRGYAFLLGLIPFVLYELFKFRYRNR
ncbi:MAG TPA: DUF1648 domain-containing protein [Clostridiales bacterium]|nr:DUF1648 domain-containing protein [Clostridiales bacterium]HPP36532.1 DUF1648 domain-containing protein [Clostridiales bacterium]